MLAAAALVLVLAGCAATDTGQPLLPGAINAPPPPMMPAGDSVLTNTIWTWRGSDMRDGARIAPDAPERYALVFDAGGTVQVRADCNRGSGSYLLSGNQMTFGAIALTKMMCPPGSRDADFLRELAAVTTQSMAGPDLVLTFGGGTMRFTTTRQ
jgi:heat shock protein HslJ